MARFQDSTGFEWDLRLNRGVLPDLKRAGIDLDRATKEADWLGEILFGDVNVLAEGLWILLAEQAQRAGITRDQFDRRLDVETFDRGGQALLDEVIDFFHRGRAKQIKARLPQMLAAIEGKVEEAADQVLAQATQSISATSVTNSPESSESIPGP